MKRAISKLIDQAALFIVLLLIGIQAAFGRDRRND